MIILDIGKTLTYNIGIDAFSCIITLIIYFSYLRDFADTHDIRLLRRTEAMILLVLLFDMLMWILDGKSGGLLRILSYTIGILFFVAEIAVVLGWLRYAWYRLFGQSILREKEMFYVFLPFTVLFLIVVTSPFTGWCFYLDHANYYHRGILAMPLYAILLAYLLSASVVALLQYRKEVFIDRKMELRTIAFFAVPPFLGGVTQTVVYGLSIIWPCAIVSSLLVLLNKQSQAILQDSLTGLNNRRSMEKHLRVYEDDQSCAVTLIMLDINNFKRINDQYGHRLGDMALIETANILRTVFSGTSAFLARFGGDEFVIIMPEGEESIVEGIIQRVRNRINDFNKTKQFSFLLSVSVGYAISTVKADNRTERLLREADENMYRDKVSVTCSDS